MTAAAHLSTAATAPATWTLPGPRCLTHARGQCPDPTGCAIRAASDHRLLLGRWLAELPNTRWAVDDDEDENYYAETADVDGVPTYATLSDAPGVRLAYGEVTWDGATLRGEGRYSHFTLTPCTPDVAQAARLWDRASHHRTGATTAHHLDRDAADRVTALLRATPTPSWTSNVTPVQLWQAMRALPDDERDAVDSPALAALLTSWRGPVRDALTAARAIAFTPR